MTSLKGQNLRIFVKSGSKFHVVGMATTCSINMVNNTEDASTKDDVNMASMPTAESQSWTVSVSSLNVSDTAAMLTAIKNMQPFTLMWDETSTNDNQTPGASDCQRIGQAYLTDGTFTFNDRTNSQKDLQFTSTGGITHDTTILAETVELGSYTKGQFVRLFLSGDNTNDPDSVIAAAKNLSLHVSVGVENVTTKDTSGTWVINEPTTLAYDITTNALMRGGDTITSQVDGKAYSDIQAIYVAHTPVKWKIANVSGANNRTAGTTIVSGSALLTNLQVNSPNRQNADYTATLNGYGIYTVGA